MRSRLLIVGASGFVGSRWALAAAQHFDVIGTARRPPIVDGWVALDITDQQSVFAAFEQARPELVTHLAALSDIDRCQREPDLAESINVTGAVHVARACARFGSRLLFTSTDAVFDGTKGIYHESDIPTPPNWYGQTKARAERAITEILPSAVIVRLSLVLGIGAVPGGNSYLEKVIGNLRAGNAIPSPTFEYRNPIDIASLCEFFIELSRRNDSRGIFHLGASDKVSRYDLARAIAQHLRCDPALIVPQTDPVAGRAPRGTDDFLATDRLREFCGRYLPTCQQVIERALDAAP